MYVIDINTLQFSTISSYTTNEEQFVFYESGDHVPSPIWQTEIIKKFL